MFSDVLALGHCGLLPGNIPCVGFRRAISARLALRSFEMADIDEKLGKSLDDLIKEASRKRQSTGGSAGPGRRSTSAGGKRFRRSGKTSADEMDVDDGGGKASALGASGGVAKVRRARGI